NPDTPQKECQKSLARLSRLAHRCAAIERMRIVDLPADVAVKIDSLVDATARAYRQGGDTRDLGHLRAGIATSFLLGESHDEPPPRPRPPRPPPPKSRTRTRTGTGTGVVVTTGPTDRPEDQHRNRRRRDR